MKNIICYPALCLASLLAACGGGDDGKSPELEPCREALISKGTNAAQLQNPASIAARDVQSDGSVILDFTNGLSPNQTGYKFYGSCRFVASKIVSVTLADGTVIPFP